MTRTESRERKLAGLILLGAALGILLLSLVQTVYRNLTASAIPAIYPAGSRPMTEILPIPEPAWLNEVNRSDAEALQTLPGVGGSLAAAIVEERELRGPFCYPEDLMMVSGIGEAKLQGILNAFPEDSGEE